MVSLIFLIKTWPMETILDVKVEIINEMVTMIICYAIMCFTDLVPDPETRYKVGFVHIGVLCLHLLVHTVMILRPPAIKVKQKCRRCRIKR